MLIQFGQRIQGKPEDSSMHLRPTPHAINVHTQMSFSERTCNYTQTKRRGHTLTNALQLSTQIHYHTNWGGCNQPWVRVHRVKQTVVISHLQLPNGGMCLKRICFKLMTAVVSHLAEQHFKTRNAILFMWNRGGLSAIYLTQSFTSTPHPPSSHPSACSRPLAAIALMRTSARGSN